MTNPIEIADEELHAFIDGELSPERHAHIERALAENADLAERVAAFVSDKSRLKVVYDKLLEQTAQDKWIALIERDGVRARRSAPWNKVAAIAAVIVLSVGTGAVFLSEHWNSLRTPKYGGEIIEEALAARSNTLSGHDQGNIESSRDNRSTSHIISSALHMRLKAPDLSRMGYSPAGVRLYNDVPGGKAIELIYRRSDGELFVLYLRHSSGSARFDQFELEKLRVCIWQDDVLGIVMTGSMSAAEMQRLASLAYTGLLM